MAASKVSRKRKAKQGYAQRQPGKPAGLTHSRLDRPRTDAKYPGTCYGCKQPYPIGTPVTPVPAPGRTVWIHWQPDLKCFKSADNRLRNELLAHGRKQILPKQKARLTSK